jgi:DNA polymerase sigma
MTKTIKPFFSSTIHLLEIPQSSTQMCLISEKGAKKCSNTNTTSLAILIVGEYIWRKINLRKILDVKVIKGLCSCIVMIT